MLAFAQTCFGFPKAHPVAAGNFFGAASSAFGTPQPHHGTAEHAFRAAGVVIGTAVLPGTAGPPFETTGPPYAPPDPHRPACADSSDAECTHRWVCGQDRQLGDGQSVWPQKVLASQGKL